MAFETGPYIERARKHLKSRDIHRLPYACLELRYALERIAYHKLQLRLDKVSPEEIGAWQPHRVMDVLMELVDSRLNQDFILQVAPIEKNSEVTEDKYSTVGEAKGVSPHEIRKHWHKIGSYLHLQMPKKKGDKPVAPDTGTLKLYLDEVINYIEDITKTGSDFYFSLNVTFDCGKCNQKIVRNRELLKPETVVQCQNPNCDASYITKIENEEFIFDPHDVRIDCKKCGKSWYFEANSVLKMKTNQRRSLTCCKCGTRHIVRWSLQYALESEIDEKSKPKK